MLSSHRILTNMYLYQIALLFLIADGLSGVTVQKSPQECTVDAYTCTLYLFVVNHPYLFYLLISLSVWRLFQLQISLVPSPCGRIKSAFLLPGGLGTRLTPKCKNYHTYPWKHNYTILKPHATVRQDLKASLQLKHGLSWSASSLWHLKPLVYILYNTTGVICPANWIKCYRCTFHCGICSMIPAFCHTCMNHQWTTSPYHYTA